MRAHILIADDDRELAAAVGWYLEAEGFRVTVADGAAAAVEVMRADPPQAAVLDMAIAGQDGFAALQGDGDAGQMPLLVLVANEAEAEQARRLGVATACATKPLGPLELVDRVRTVLGQMESPPRASAEVPGLEMRLGARQVLIKGEALALSDLEFDLLRVLMDEPQTPLTRSQISDRLWGDDYYGDLRLVDTHVSRLRRKLRQAGMQPVPVVTVRGVGYTFDPEV